LDHAERKWGGIDAYLEAAGLPASTITQLKQKLTD
jgi:hypothetical protein